MRRFHKTSRFVVLALMLALPARVFAEPAPTPEEVQQAQARWNEGKAYFDTGNFEAARVAFKQAYTVFPHAAFLQNLGEAEFRTGRNVEAARHFTAFLRASSSGTPAQREAAKKSLVKAAEKLGSIIVTTNVDDAEIRVDDDLVGRSPLGSFPWYVEPGRHIVTARKEGYLDGSERIDVPVGVSKNVMVRVQRVVGGTSESPPEPKEHPTQLPVQPDSPKPPPPATLSAPAGPLGDRTQFQTRTVVLLGGAALTIGGLAVAAGFALKTSSDSARIEDTQSRLRAKDACLDPTEPGIVDLCQSLADDTQQRHTARTVRNLAFIGAGVVGVATLTTLFLWRPRRDTSVSLIPAFTPSSQGLLISGQF